MQCVWLWGIGQEIMDLDQIIKNVENSENWKKMSDQEKEVFKLRLKAPYPLDTTKRT